MATKKNRGGLGAWRRRREKRMTSNLRVDKARLGRRFAIVDVDFVDDPDFDVVEIPIRAQGDDTKYGTYDVAELDKRSLLEWLRSRGGVNSFAENVVGLLLGHGHLVEVDPITENDIRTANAQALKSEFESCYLELNLAETKFLRDPANDPETKARYQERLDRAQAAFIVASNRLLAALMTGVGPTP